MNYLINSEFVAIRRFGNDVPLTASEESGEFILNSDSNFPIATLKEISDANNLGIKTVAVKKQNVLTNIINKLGEKKMTEQNELTETQKVEMIVKDGMESSKDHDAILVEIVSAGVKFRNATKIFKATLEALGYAVAPKEIKEKITASLKENNFKPEKWPEVEKVVEWSIENVKGATRSIALSAIRKYAKDNEFVLPKQEKKETRGRKAGNTKMMKLAVWLNENPTSTEKDFETHIAEVVEKEAQRKGYMRVYELVMTSRKSAIESAASPNTSEENVPVA